MSFFGDVIGAIGDAFSEVAKVVAAPVELVIDTGAKLLGLPPLFADALKISVGALTADWVVVADGAKDFVKDLAGEAATTEYAPGEEAAAASGWSTEGTSSAAADGSAKGSAPAAVPGKRSAAGATGSAALTEADSADDDASESSASEVERASGLDAAELSDDDAAALAAFRVLLAHFDELDRAGGAFLGLGPSGVISRAELQRISEDASASVELKRAARYLLDHAEVFDRFGRSKGANDEGLSRKDLELAVADLGGTSSPSSPTGSTGSSRSGAAGAASGGSSALDPAEALAAATILRQQFEAVDDALHVGSLTIGLHPDVLTRSELERISDDPRASGDLKQAARYVLDHPEVWAFLARSSTGTFFGGGISRGDLDILIARGGHLPGAVTPSAGGSKPPPTNDPPSGGGKAGGTSGTSSSSSSGSTSSSAGRKALRDILRDKSLSNEEKIEAILMVLIDESDKKLVTTAKELDDAAAKRDKLKTNDKNELSKLDKLDRDLNFKLQRLTERKQKLETLLSNMQQKFTQMAMTAIVNLGR
jgi:hypothetical protein